MKCGLEIHVYIDTKEKLFCSCPIHPDSKPNTNICPVCTGQPGAKPELPNQEAIQKVIKTGLILGCRINHNLVWQRKHYDWPDLPKGYQTTMSGSYAVPVGEKGSFLGIGITEIHLEEDPARWNPETGEVDYNRSGYPLIEIVTDPDFKEVTQVRDWLKSLIKSLSYVKAVNKAQGVKCDVNVSIPPKFQRVEIKNVNSFKSIIKAIAYEVSRQEKTTEIKQETRAWTEKEGITKFMRSKENALDYRFIPDPDLPVVEISNPFLKSLKQEVPESPEVKKKKLIQLGVEKITAEIISRDLYLTAFLEHHKKLGIIFLANWLRKELLRVLNLEKKEFEELSVKENHLLELITLWKNQEISPEIGRQLLEKLVTKDFPIKAYVKQKSLGAIQGNQELEKLCQQALKEKTEAVKDYQQGSIKSLNSLVGVVMKKTQGKAQPQKVKEILIKLLD